MRNRGVFSSIVVRPYIFFGFAVGETAATGGGMRRGSASPAAKPLEIQGLETPGEKLLDPLYIN
jgi:hypothetical protein